MDGPSATILLVLAANPASARRWTEILEGPQTTVWQRRPVPGDGRPDVIVTDLAEVEDRPGGDPAVVRIGNAGTDDKGHGDKNKGDGGCNSPADVWLPADCSPRELVLACQLLAQIVRLRRRERQAAEIHQELSVQALSDPLTGLPNRRAWDLALQEWVAAAADGANQLCVAILDLDHFKQINDVHGHVIGDEVLRASGQEVYDNLRQDDFVARLGGDEFGLLLWVPDDEVTVAILERVRTALPERYRQAGLPTLTASVGYRLAGRGDPRGGPFSTESLYAAADAALRAAKQGGRNRTVGLCSNPQ
jgi:diguanylate cyclase (GGDEF)-like protein